VVCATLFVLVQGPTRPGQCFGTPAQHYSNPESKSQKKHERRLNLTRLAFRPHRRHIEFSDILLPLNCYTLPSSLWSVFREFSLFRSVSGDVICGGLGIPCLFLESRQQQPFSLRLRHNDNDKFAAKRNSIEIKDIHDLQLTVQQPTYRRSTTLASRGIECRLPRFLSSRRTPPEAVG
jgi:hypothetical protein